MPDPLPPEDLRWICDPAVFPFESTAEIEPGPEFLTDEAALEALQFGLRSKAQGQNVFVRGLYGAARMVFLSRLVRRLQPLCPLKQDRCYVHNFGQPDRPRLISLRAGQARRLRKELQGLVDFVQRTLPKALDSGIVQERRRALERRLEEDVNAITAPFEQELTGSGLQLVTIQIGPMTQAAVFPVVDGKPVPPEELNALVQQGKLEAADKEAFEKRIPDFSARMAEVVTAVEDLRQERVRQIEDLVTRSAREMLEKHRRRILDKHPVPALEEFLDELIDDVLEHLLVADGDEAEDRSQLYELHLLQDNTDDDVCPVVVEHHPSLVNLLGTVEQAFGPEGPQPSDYRCIRAGSLLKADGGYLILDADDLIGEPGAWKVLVRTLRTGTMEITPPELPGWAQGHALKPEPIPIQVRVLLVGATGTYELLDFADKDFPELFKCLVDIDPYVDAEPEVLNQYAALLARVAADEGMPPFHRDAIAALAEHAARIAARRHKLSTRLSRLADIAREAAFLARDAGHPVVTADDVRGAVHRTKQRAMMPSRIYREEVLEGTILLETRGTCVGQINGLAVMSSGPLTYGFPVRITASLGPGSLGIVDIEERSKMSGSIHTKGFEILQGLLRWLLIGDHPLTFHASLAFEQSYGGIDGDSASGAEFCCLLSAMTDVPLRQDVAMTGAVDQHGHLQAIGGVNEKIEGFFDVCAARGLTGTQGVLVPAANGRDLMLRPDVVEAARAGQFHVWALATIQEALEVLTGMPAGGRVPGQPYPDGTLLGLAQRRSRELWQSSLRRSVD